jgi:hypothetical protein
MICFLDPRYLDDVYSLIPNVDFRRGVDLFIVGKATHKNPLGLQATSNY